MAATNTAGKCENNYCEVPGRTLTIGSPEGVGDPDEHPQKQVTVSAKSMRRTEVTVGEMRAFLAKNGTDLSVVLSGCSSLGSQKIVVKGKPGETAKALLKRARQIAASASCSTDGLKVDRQPKQGMQMGGYCGKMNSRGDDHPYVCADQAKADAFCASEGGTVPSEVDIENASRGASGKDDHGTPIGQAVIGDYRTGDNWGTQPVCGPNNERENSLGICDLAGNAWERTSTRYVLYDDPAYSSNPTDPNPRLEKNADGSYKNDQRVVSRGGSWGHGQSLAHAAYRFKVFPGFRVSDFGFRCVRPRPQPQDSR